MKENENDDIIKDVLYNKDGTVDYVFDNAKLDKIIAPFLNETNSGEGRSGTLFLSSSQGDN